MASKQDGLEPLFAALPIGGEICALQLDDSYRVTQASPGCRALFRREVSGLLGSSVSALFGGLELPAEASGSRDFEVPREGRPGHARVYWTRSERGTTLLIADLQKMSSGGLSEVAASARFAAESVHEIRNSLTSVKLVVQTLQRMTSLPRVARQQAIALREVRAIERVVSALAGLIATPSALESLSIGGVVEEAFADTRRDLEERGLALRVVSTGGDSSVKCDKARLGLALRQLAGGLAHGLESGEVSVEVTADGTGVGLRLQTMPPHSSKPSGMALSVDLARKVAGEHGGELREIEGGYAFSLPVPTGAKG